MVILIFQLNQEAGYDEFAHYEAQPRRKKC